MKLEEEYVILKYIELLWTHTGHVPEKYLDILERYNVNSLIDLDKVVHKIHKMLENDRDSLREAKGDIEYIEYLLDTLFNSVIISSKGNGVSKPGYIETRYLNCLIKLISPRSAEILIDTDYEVGILEFADDCLEDFKNEYFEDDVEVISEGSTMRLVSDNIDALAEVIRLLGEGITVEDVKVKDNEVVLINVEDKDEVLEILKEAYNSYIAYDFFIADTDGTIYRPIYLERASNALNKLAKELQGIVNMKVKTSDIAKVHLHDDKVHVHGKLKIYVETSNTVLLPFVIAGVISSIDINGTHEEKHFTPNVQNVVKIIRGVWRQTGLVEKKELVENIA